MLKGEKRGLLGKCVSYKGLSHIKNPAFHQLVATNTYFRPLFTGLTVEWLNTLQSLMILGFKQTDDVLINNK